MLGLSAGQIIADKYRIDRVIGSGGMGVVVAATHVELDQKVAIKLLRDAHDESIARFRREARLLVKLKSQHVARVFDVGSLDDDTPFIVMELLEGKDLSALVTERGGRLSTEEAVDYVLEATEAVAEAHVLGMVHRDLKPANLFLGRGPGGSTVVKVLDFGVSKMLDANTEQTSAGTLTNEGVALGSPGYMAPEQMTSSRDVDVRADIYSLGAMLYRLVSGRNPYKGNSLVSVLAAMAMDPLPPLKTLVPEVPDAFAAVVEKCLAQDPAARFETVAHLAYALAPFGTRRARDSAEQVLATMNIALEPFGATIVRPLTVSTSYASRPSSIPPPALPPPPAVDRSWMLLAAGGLFLGVMLVVVFWGASAARPKPPPETAPPATVTSTPLPPQPVVPVVVPTIEPAPSASAPRPATTKPPGAATKRAPHPHATTPSTAPPSPTDVPAGRL